MVWPHFLLSFTAHKAHRDQLIQCSCTANESRYKLLPQRKETADRKKLKLKVRSVSLPTTSIFISEINRSVRGPITTRVVNGLNTLFYFFWFTLCRSSAAVETPLPPNRRINARGGREKKHLFPGINCCSWRGKNCKKQLKRQLGISRIKCRNI